MWMIGLYLLFGIMTWVVYDTAAKEMDGKQSDAIGMAILIAAWPWYWYNWFTTQGQDHGSE